MPIINCPECNAEISDQATQCPKCAYPIKKQTDNQNIQTIEQTSKKLKKEFLFSILVLIIGIVMAFSSPGGNLSLVATVLITVGLVWLISVKIRIWWHHK